MVRQRQVLLSLALFLGLFVGQVAAMSIDNSDLVVHVFTSLQRDSTGDTLPPFPEGIELELICQATDRTTYWYERRPLNKYPDPVKDKLPTTSVNLVPGVRGSVYTIPSLTKEDDGRELWCMTDSSTVKNVVQLDVVGPPSTFNICYSNKTEGLELSCSSDSVDPHLELCWYRGDERLQCKVPEGNGTSPTAVMTHVSVDDWQPKLVCKVLFKEGRELEILKKYARTRFDDMLKEASVEVSAEGQDIQRCEEISPQGKSSSHASSSTTERPMNQETTGGKPKTSKTTPTTATSPGSTVSRSTSVASSPTVEQSPTVKQSTTVKQSPTVEQSSTVASSPTTPETDYNWKLIIFTLLVIVIVLLLVLLVIAVGRLFAKLKVFKTRNQNTPNRNQSSGTPSNSDHPVMDDNLASGQFESKVGEYRNAMDTSDHRWPAEGEPLDHAYYYPDITEQVREEIIGGHRSLTSRTSRSGADVPAASTRSYNAINHSYHYPVLTEEMKRFLATTGERGDL